MRACSSSMTLRRVARAARRPHANITPLTHAHTHAARPNIFTRAPAAFTSHTLAARLTRARTHSPQANRRFAAFVLKKLGCTVATATDGDEVVTAVAAAAAAGAPYDLVLMDLVMVRARLYVCARWGWIARASGLVPALLVHPGVHAHSLSARSIGLNELWRRRLACRRA